MTTAKTRKTGQAAKPRSTADQSKPWQRANPQGPGEHSHLSPQAKASAKRRAKATGRPYPNLVDNMRAARTAKK